MFIEKGRYPLLVSEGRYVYFLKLTICEANKNNELISTRRLFNSKGPYECKKRHILVTFP